MGASFPDACYRALSHFNVFLMPMRTPVRVGFLCVLSCVLVLVDSVVVCLVVLGVCSQTGMHSGIVWNSLGVSTPFLYT
jgi:hypothetical protein